jgi:MFS family permease
VALLTGRVIQGIGGAALTTTSLALLRVVWGRDAGRAIGLWTSLTSVATIGGPPLGGVIVDAISWRWVFFINLPLAAVVVALAVAGRSAAERSTGRSTLDVVGAALTAVGLVGVTYALVEVEERGVVSVLPAALIGLAALAALAVWTLRARDPLVPPALLRCAGLVQANVVTLVVYAALGAHLLFVPVYLQFLGFSPTVAGLAFTPPSLAMILLAPMFGRIADAVGPRWPIAVGAGSIGIGVLLLLPIDSRHEAWIWTPPSLVCTALGLAALVAPITAAALSPAPEQLAGVASGLNQTVARVGGILAVAAVGALAAWAFARAGGSGESPFRPGVQGGAQSATVEAFRWAVAAIASLAFAGSALAAVLLRGSRPDRQAFARGRRVDRSTQASVPEAG